MVAKDSSPRDKEITKEGEGMEETILRQIKNDFREIAQEKLVSAILLFGSQTSNEATSRSDIDVCIVAPAVEDRITFLRRIWRQITNQYDLWFLKNYLSTSKQKLLKTIK
ncbi:MAG: hypothetical protein GF308_21745 [Candidatus Heimdallarchaeota archaeon]|nr:hypothetical protein [Candidatus Heimdallarchaeota archaeon]